MHSISRSRPAVNDAPLHHALFVASPEAISRGQLDAFHARPLEWEKWHDAMLTAFIAGYGIGELMHNFRSRTLPHT